MTLGVVPDFTYQGDGVRITGVTPGTPAAAAGLTRGDILIEVAGKKLHGLSDLSVALQGASAGQRVEVAYKRGTDITRVEVALVAR